MKKENRTTAIWVCRVLVHVGIAGIVSGLLMIGYFLYKGNFTTLNSSFEASQGFYDAYDTMMTWAEDAIWIKIMWRQTAPSRKTGSWLWILRRTTETR